VYERSKFKGSHLIASLLSLLAPMLITAILYGIIFEMMGVNEDSMCKDIFTVSFLILLLTGFVMFWVFLIKFFIKNKTVCLVIAPDEEIIEFWKEKKYSAETNELLMEIKRRKEIVEETLMQPYKNIVGFFEERSILPKFFFLIYLFSLPAIITRKLSLTYLLLLPIAWFFYRKIEFNKQPKEYRKAIKSYFNKEWDQAISLLKVLRARIPEYLPTYTLLVNVYTRANRFDEALEVASELPDEYIDLVQDIQTDIWLYKRIYKRRKDNLKQVK
jgi:pentatricopeptide repeat protein